MKALPARLAAGGEAQVKMEEDIGDTTRKGLMSAARYYYYLPIAFSRICVYALKKRRRTISDVRMLMFLLRTPWLYLLGFKGKLKTPFGKVLIRNRDKMRSTAYGTFKTRFSYLEEISEVAPGKPFFPVVVDVGANVGDFTLAMAGHSGRVIAIEPGLGNFRALESNIEANGIRNATALKIAAHNREETLRLDGIGSMLHVVENSAKGEVASGRPLDQVLAGLNIGQVDLLKVDVQGHEEKVLNGMSGLLKSRRVGMLVVEVHPTRGVRPSSITLIMRGYGYRLIKNDDYIFGQPHLYYVPDGTKQIP